MSDAEKQVTYLNQTWLDYTDWPVDAALGYRWVEILHPDDLERCRELYEKAFELREPFRMEYRLRRHDGEYRWVLTVGVPRYDADGSFAGYIGTAVDIAERKLAEEALSTVSQKLIEAHEEERARIARELHDDISQQLALVSMRLDYLRQTPSGVSGRSQSGDRGRLPTDWESCVRHSGAVTRSSPPEAGTHGARRCGGGVLRRVVQSAWCDD